MDERMHPDESPLLHAGAGDALILAAMPIAPRRQRLRLLQRRSGRASAATPAPTGPAAPSPAGG